MLLNTEGFFGLKWINPTKAFAGRLTFSSGPTARVGAFSFGRRSEWFRLGVCFFPRVLLSLPDLFICVLRCFLFDSYVFKRRPHCFGSVLFVSGAFLKVFFGCS